MPESRWLGWHFLPDDGALNYGEKGKKEYVQAGRTYEVPYDKISKPLSLCYWGLHACRKALDALGYAPGMIVCRVELEGEIIERADKACASRRKVLAIGNAATTIHEFACWCAEGALQAERKAGREPDPRSWKAIEAKRKWLRGEITNDELRAARAAARAAAGVAAWGAAWAAAGEAAGEAAREAAGEAAGVAAWGAAGEAAWGAAWAAAGEAAREAAGEAQNAKLEEMLHKLLGKGVVYEE